MNKQRFGYIRMFAKGVSLPLAIAGVFIFIWEYLPTYMGRGIWFYVFFVAGIVWALDTLWSALDDIKEACEKIPKNKGVK